MNDLKNKYIRVYTDNLDGLQTFEGLCTGVGDGFIYLRSRSGFDQCFPVVRVNRVIVLKLEIKGE